MLSLNINKLRSEVEDREQKKLKIFENILEMCYQKILNTNKKSDNYNCTFIVPNVVFGLPLYNIGDCITFIMDKLVDKGFEIYFALPTTIHISWQPEGYKNTNSYINNNINTQSIPNTQIEYYNSLQPQKQLVIKYNGINKQNKYYNNNKSNNKIYNNNETINNNIQYRPIDTYTSNSDSIYDINDLDIFQNKVEKIF